MSFGVFHRPTANVGEAYDSDRREFPTPFAACEAAFALAVRRYGQGYTIIVVPAGKTEPTFIIKT